MRFASASLFALVIALVGCGHDDCGVVGAAPDMSVCTPCLDNLDCGSARSCVLLGGGSYACYAPGDRDRCGPVAPACAAPSACLEAHRLATRYVAADGTCGQEIVYCAHGCITGGDTDAGAGGGGPDDGSALARCAP